VTHADRAQGHVFASGPPRAGTTLLELVLSAHPDVTVTPEARFIDKLLPHRWPVGASLTSTQADAVREAMSQDEKLASWPGFDLDEFLASDAVREGKRLAEILDAVFLWFARAHGGRTRWIGNKKGLYADRWGLHVKKIFPDAKFVFIVRDPRDVVPSIVSNLEHLWYASPREASMLLARRGVHMNRMRNRYPEDVHILRYEELVLEPSQACDRLCEFLDVAPSSEMLEFYKGNEGGERLLGNRKAIHPHTRTPFNPALIGRWRDGKSVAPSDLAEIEAVTADYMARFGYEPSAPPRRPLFSKVVQSWRTGQEIARTKLVTRRRILFPT
jgi:Sulfotransferase family